MNTPRRLLLWLACLCAVTPAQPAIAQLHLPDRTLPDANLLGITEQGWMFRTADNERLTKGNVVRWGAWPGLTQQQAVWLSDGGWLAGDVRMESDSRIALESDWFQVPGIELTQVRGLVINPPASLTEWIALQKQMQEASGNQDVLWLLDKQRISGVIRWSGDGQELVLEAANRQSATIAWDDIQAIVFSPTLIGPPPSVYPHSIGMSDGSLLHYETMRLLEQSPVFDLPSGLRLTATTPRSEWTSAVRYLAGRPDSVRFLSDLQPASYRQPSDNRLQWELGIDRDCYARPLLWNGGIVAKGLALHSPAQVAYRCDGSSQRFLAQVVMAQPAPQTTLDIGQVVCKVLLARGGKLDEVARFELGPQSEADPKNAGHLLDIDLTGSQLLVLLIEKGEFGSIGDHVLWLDARLSP